MRTPFRPARTLAAAAALLVAACSERAGLRETRPDETSDARRPSFAIADATNSGRAGFYFLTPLVPSLPSYPGTFDPAVAASARICPAPVASCPSPLATFTTGGGGLTVDVARQAYVATWPVPVGLTLGTDNYRLEVRAAGTTLGFADLNVVAAPAPSVPGYVNAVRGGTLTIRFRIETGMVGAVSVAPPSASVAVGGTQTFTAAVTDLHGNAIPSPTVAWQSANPGVATVSPTSGTATTATGVADGSAFIVATSNGVSGQATLAVSSNAAPVAQADAYQANAGSAITVPAGTGLLANDNRGTPLATVASFGGGSLGGSAATNAAGSTVTFGSGGSLTVQADGSLSFTPAAGFTGDFVFHYRLTNAAGSSDATVTIGVVRVPSAVNDSYTDPLSGSLVVAAHGVMANDDRGVPQGSVASFGGGSLGGTAATHAAGASVSDGNGGTIQLDANGALTHTPSGAFAGTITFQYRLTNAVGSSDATVTITVPQAPSAVADAYTTTLAGTLTVPANGVLANDALGSPAGTITHFGGGSLGGAVTTNAVGATVTFGSGGSLQLNADGSLTFTRSAGFSGTFTFLYRLTNAHATSDATVTITVPRVPDAVNDAPAGGSAPGQPFHTALNTQLVIPAAASPSLLSNDDRGVPPGSVTKFGGGSLSGTVDDHDAGTSASFGAGGSLTIAADGAVTFTPPTNFTGLFTAQYRLANAHGSDVATLTIAVGARPAAANDTYAPKLLGNVNIATATSTGFTVASNDQGDQLTFAVVPGSAVHGTAALLPGGTFTFNPERGYEGPASFQYQITNGFGSATATVNLTIEKMVWFIDDGAPAGGDGRFLSPYNALAAFQTANGAGGSANPENGEGIFLYSGDYTGPVTLRTGQRLVGQGATGASLAALLGVTWPADAPTPPSIGGARPTITSASNDVNLGADNVLRGVTLGDATGSALSGTGFGTLGTADVAILTAGQAISLTTGTIDGDFLRVSSAGGANNVLLSGVGTVGTTDLGTAADALSGATGDALRIHQGAGSFTYAGSVTNATARAVRITSKTGGTTLLSGQINPAAAARGIEARDNTGGTITFGGTAAKIAVAGTAHAVELDNNDGSLVEFTGGGLAAASDDGDAFRAVNGGTVRVAGAGNTLTATGGAALRVTGTTIGTGGLTFQRVSADGGASGILLNGTGSTAGLTVTGTGSGALGGDNSGGEIQNTTGPGVSLTSTQSVSLRNMNVHNTVGHGVGGTGVAGFSFLNGKIDRSGLNAGLAAVGAPGTSNIGFNAGGAGVTNLTGTVNVTGSVLTNAFDSGIRIINEAGTIDHLTVTGNTLTGTGAAATSQGSAIAVDVNGSAGTGSAVTRATVTGNTINSFPSGAGIQIQGGNGALGPAVTLGVPGSGTDVVTISGNSIGATTAIGGIGTNGIATGVTGTGRGKFAITDNLTIRHFKGIGVVNFSGNAATVEALIHNNNLDATDNISNSSGMSVGIQIAPGQKASITATITSNTLVGMEGNGILAGVINSGSAGAGQSVGNFTIKNNSVGAPAAGVRPGIRVESGSASGDALVCLDIAGNTSAGSGGTQGIGLRKQGSSTAVNVFGIRNLSPSPAGTPTVENLVNAQNPSGGGTLLISATTGFTSCTTAP